MLKKMFAWFVARPFGKKEKKPVPVPERPRKVEYIQLTLPLD